MKRNLTWLTAGFIGLMNIRLIDKRIVVAGFTPALMAINDSTRKGNRIYPGFFTGALPVTGGFNSNSSAGTSQ